MTTINLSLQWRPAGATRWFRAGDIVRIEDQPRALFRIQQFHDGPHGVYVVVVGGKRGRVPLTRTFTADRICGRATRRQREEFDRGKW